MTNENGNTTPQREADDSELTFAQETERSNKINAAISRALDKSPITHIGTRAEVVPALRRELADVGIKFMVADNGAVITMLDGKRVPLADAANERLLLGGLAERDSVATGILNGAVTVKSKDDLKTPKEKSAFISTYPDEWERLPIHRETVPERVEYRDDLRTIKQKSDWISANSLEAYERLGTTRPKK